MIVFVDTNVLVDLVCNRQSKQSSLPIYTVAEFFDAIKTEGEMA